ncbi:hypothetical protein EON64_05390, partial [archaeon]
MSRQPTSQPTSGSTHQRQPSWQPSMQPSSQPSVKSRSEPTTKSSAQPSSQPSPLPSRQPSSQPTRQPITQPSLLKVTTSRPTFAIFAPIPVSNGNNNNSNSNNASLAVNVLTSLTSSQGEISVITETVRVSSQRMGTVAPGVATSIGLPMTDEEIALQAAGQLVVPSISLTGSSMGGNSNYSSGFVAAALLDSSLWPMRLNQSSARPQEGELQSSIIAISITGVDVQHVDISFPPSAIKDSNLTMRAINFTVTCPPKILVQKAYMCEDTGYVEVVNCKGIAGTFDGQCPTLQQTCAALDLSTLTLASQNLCQTVNSRNSSQNGGNETVPEGITCRCGLSPEAATGSSTIAAGVVTSLVSADLSKAFEASSAFSDGSAATKAATLVGLFCALWGATVLVVMYYGWLWKKKGVVLNGEKIDTLKSGLTEGKCKKVGTTTYSDDLQPLGNGNLRRASMLRVHSVWQSVTASATRRLSLINNNMTVTLVGEGKVNGDKGVIRDDTNGIENKPDPSQQYQKELEKAALRSYLSSLFPAVFLSRSFLEGVLRQIYRKHPYINLFFRLHHSPTPILDVVKVLTLQSFLLFMLALLYDLNYPSDDGSCVLHTTRQVCLERKYDLDPSKSYCQWQPLVYDISDGVQESDGVYVMDDMIASTGFYECVFLDPSFSFTVLMYVSLMISFGTSLVMEPLEYLLELLASPLLSDSKIHVSEQSEDAARLVAPYLGTSRSTDESSAEKQTEVRAEQGTTKGANKSEKVRKETICRRVPGAHRASFLEITRSARSNAGIFVFQNLRAGFALSLERLENAVELQRRHIKKTFGSRSLSDFDNAWCLDHNTGGFAEIQQLTVARDHAPLQAFFALCWKLSNRQASQPPQQRDGRNAIVLSMRDVVQTDISDMHKESNELQQELGAMSSEAEQGFEMMIQFVLDILDRKSAAAHIYAMSMEQEYSKMQKVSMLVKASISLLLLGLNGFFFYFTLLRGISKGSAWQRSYVLAWVLQLLLEVFFSETMQCFWFHYFIPSLAMKEVQKAEAVVRQTMQDMLHNGEAGMLQEVHKQVDNEDSLLLNAPSFLFVSYQLARKYPSLPESRLVTTYRNYLPGNMSVRWCKLLEKWKKKQAVQEQQRRTKQFCDMEAAGESLEGTTSNDAGHSAGQIASQATGVIDYLSLPKRLLLSAILYLVAKAPIEAQRIVMRILEPILLAGLAFFVLLLRVQPILLGVTCLLLVLWVISLVYNHVQAVKQSRKEQQVSDGQLLLEENAQYASPLESVQRSGFLEAIEISSSIDSSFVSSVSSLASHQLASVSSGVSGSSSISVNSSSSLSGSSSDSSGSYDNSGRSGSSGDSQKSEGSEELISLMNQFELSGDEYDGIAHLDAIASSSMSSSGSGSSSQNGSEHESESPDGPEDLLLESTAWEDSASSSGEEEDKEHREKGEEGEEQEEAQEDRFAQEEDKEEEK